jgi:hypothetical protein
VERANRGTGLRIKKVLDNNVANLIRQSDQWTFLPSRVPAVFFHAGLHPDYHTADDRPEKIRYEKTEGIARLAHQSSWDLAQRPGRPRHDQGPSSTASSRRADVSPPAAGPGGRWKQRTDRDAPPPYRTSY